MTFHKEPSEPLSLKEIVAMLDEYGTFAHSTKCGDPTIEASYKVPHEVIMRVIAEAWHAGRVERQQELREEDGIR